MHRSRARPNWKKPKGVVNRAELLKRFGYLSHVLVNGFVTRAGKNFQRGGARTYLLTNMLICGDDGEELFMDHMWVSDDRFTDDLIGRNVTYMGEVRTYEKDSGSRSYEIVPLEIYGADDEKMEYIPLETAKGAEEVELYPRDF